MTDTYSTAIRSGVRRLRLVAPHPKASARARAEIGARGAKGVQLEEASSRLRDPLCCDLVCYSQKDEDLITRYALYGVSLSCPGLDCAVISECYAHIRECFPGPVWAKRLMKVAGAGWGRTKELLALFEDSGLFTSVPDTKGRKFFIPYYPVEGSGGDLLLVLRKLLSSGWDPVLDGRLVRCSMGRLRLTLGFSIDDLNSPGAEGAKVLIHPDSPIANFSGIRTYTLEDFLSARVLLP